MVLVKIRLNCPRGTLEALNAQFGFCTEPNIPTVQKSLTLTIRKYSKDEVLINAYTVALFIVQSLMEWGMNELVHTVVVFFI